MNEETTPKAAPTPGYKTTEFWMTVVASLVGLAMASGAFPEAGPLGRVLGMVAAALSTFGYSVSRGIAKK